MDKYDLFRRFIEKGWSREEATKWIVLEQFMSSFDCMKFDTYQNAFDIVHSMLDELENDEIEQLFDALKESD